MSNALYRVTNQCKDKSLVGKIGTICLIECEFPHSIIVQVDSKKCCFGPWEVEPFNDDEKLSKIRRDSLK